MRSEPKMPAAIGQLYEAAEMALDDGENLYHNWLDAGRQQLSFFDEYVMSLRKGTDALAGKAMAIAAANADAASHFARSLMRAKDPNEVLDLQLAFWRERIETLAAQMQQLGETALKAADLAL